MSGQRSFTPVDENGEPSGTPNDDGINNNWGGECSRACTLWNPDTELGDDGLPCNIYGHDPEQGCSVEPPACPSNDPTPASTSVTEEVRQILPAWVPVLDYSQGFDLSEPCPGNLKKYQHNIYGEAVCSPPYATDFPPAAEGCPDNFYKIVVQAPADPATGEKLCYSGVKGQIVSSTKGPNVHHFLTGEIAAEPNAPGFNKTWYRTDATGEISLESRYVDGISITHGAPGDRKHVFTLAHGMANGSPENAVNDYDTCLGPASTGNNLP